MSSTTLPNVAKIEYDTLTQFQKRIHGIIDTDPDEDIPSLYTYKLMKQAWSSSFVEQLNRNASNPDDGSAEYTPNDTFHYLKKIRVTVETPVMKVKSEFEDNVQITICHNFVNNVVKSAKLYADGDIIQNSSTMYLDWKAECDQRVGQGIRELNKKMRGHRHYYGTWVNNLPSFKLGDHLHFYYSSHIKKSLPLFLKESQSKFIFRFKFETRVEELIRMRIRNNPNDEWTEIKFNFDYVDYVKERIDFPILTGKYSCISQPEVEHRKNFPHEYYSEDMILIPSDSEVTYGHPCTINLSSVAPCTTMAIVAQNIDAKKLNNHSNYSTNTHNIDKGYNPIESIKEMYGTSIRIPKLSNIHFDSFEHLEGSKSAPEDPGWNVIHQSDRPFKLHPDVGVSLYKNNPKIVIQMGDTNPYNKPSKFKNTIRQDGQENNILFKELDRNGQVNNVEAGPKFRVYVMLIVVRKIIFEFNKKVVIKRDNEDIINKIESHYIDSSL